MTVTQGRRPALPETPPARRGHRPGWRSPRLLLGILLVAASVLLGAWALAAADDTVGVWAVSRDLPAGAAVTRSVLEVRQVRFSDHTTADRYLPAPEAPPADARLAHPLAAGELLPRAALEQQSGPELVEVPVSVAVGDLPTTVREGSHVDVWVSPEVATAESGRVRARRVLEDVVVVGVPRTGDSLAPDTTRQVIVGVPEDRSGELGPALGAMSHGRVVIARVG